MARMAMGDARTRERADGVLVAVVLAVVALLVRLPGLGHGLWLDEIATLVDFVRLPCWEIASSYQSPNNHLLYSLLAHASIQILGESPWALRLPALLFGVATVPALYFAARLWVTEREAIGAALVLALSYHHAYFSQNARGYTGLVFFTVLSTAFLGYALAYDRRHYWIGFAVAAALNVYVLLSGLFAVVALVLGVLVLRMLPGANVPRPAPLSRLALWVGAAAVLTLLLHAPVLAQMYTFYTTTEADVGWKVSQDLLGVIVRDAVPAGRVALAGGVAMAGVPIVLMGLARLGRTGPLAYFAFVAPPLLELAMAAGMGAGSYPRRFLLLVPFGALVGVLGVAELARWIGRWAGPRLATGLYWGGVALGMVAAGAGLPRLYRIPKQDFQGALAYVAARRTAGDVLAGAYIADGPTRYFEPAAQSARTAEDLERLLDQGSRVWLIGTFLSDLEQRAPALDSLIEQTFVERARFAGLVGDGTVVVWERRR